MMDIKPEEDIPNHSDDASGDDFPEVESGPEQDIKVNKEGPKEFKPMDKDVLISKVFDTLQTRFDDELRGIGPIFLKATYYRMEGAKKRAIASADFSQDVLSELEEKLKEDGAEPELLEITHPEFWVANEKDEIVVPVFDFKVELPLFAEAYKRGGCRMTFEYSPKIAFGDIKFEQTFGYTQPFLAVQETIRELFNLSGRSIDKESILTRVFNHFTSANLLDKEMHRTFPDAKYEGSIYKFTVKQAMLPDKTELFLRDTSGFVAKAAEYYKDKSNMDFRVEVKDSVRFVRCAKRE